MPQLDGLRAIAVVAVAVMLGLEPVRQILPWLLTYNLNFYMAVQGWYVDHFAHFWTLAVEEQFYIVWPWFVLIRIKCRKRLMMSFLVTPRLTPNSLFDRLIQACVTAETITYKKLIDGKST